MHRLAIMTWKIKFRAIDVRGRTGNSCRWPYVDGVAHNLRCSGSNERSDNIFSFKSNHVHPKRTLKPLLTKIPREFVVVLLLGMKNNSAKFQFSAQTQQGSFFC